MRLIGDARANLILYGHIHYASSGTVHGQRLASIGATGFPFDRDQRAAYAIVTWDGTAWRVAHRRVDYDVQAVIDDLHDSGAPFADLAAGRLQLCDGPATRARAMMLGRRRTEIGGVVSPEQQSKRKQSGCIADFSGDAAFLAHNLTTGAEIGHRPDAVMPTASTIKLLVLAELYAQVEAGDIRLDDPVTMIAEDRHGGSGILKDLSPTLVATVHDHATLMTALSDNTSTAVLVRLLGLDRILASARAWGMDGDDRHLHWHDARVRDEHPARHRAIVDLIADG